jgi:hypothetical protein
LESRFADKTPWEVLLRLNRLCIWIGLISALLMVPLSDAQAIRFQQRPDWMVSVGWGLGRGSFTDRSGVTSAYRKGAVPVMRVGRMIGSRLMLGVNYGAWVIEYGDVPLKHRRSMQNLDVALAVFPGNPEGASGGIYLRFGGGLGWSAQAEVEILPDEPQGHGHRTDEFGIGFFGEAGYEFWITHHFTAGLGLTYNYFQIEETNVQSSWFSAAIVNFNLYF